MIKKKIYKSIAALLLALPLGVTAQTPVSLGVYRLETGTGTYASLATRGGTYWTEEEQTAGMAQVTMPFDLPFGTDTIHSGDVLVVWPAKGMALTTTGCIFAPLSQLSSGDTYTGIGAQTVATRVAADTVEVEWIGLQHGNNVYTYQLMIASSGDVQFHYGTLTVTQSKYVAVGLNDNTTGESMCLNGYSWVSPSIYTTGLSTRSISSYSKPADGTVYKMIRPVCNVEEVPYSYGFEDAFATTGLPTACWATAHLATGGTSNWNKGYSGHSGTGSAKLAYTYGRTEPNYVTLATPPIDIPVAGGYTAGLWIKRTSGTTTSALSGVRVFASPTADTADGTLLFFAPLYINTTPTVSEAGWYYFEGVIPDAGVQRIVICGASLNDDIQVDDITVTAMPNCSHPTELAWDAENLQVTWEAGTATQWQVRDGNTYAIVNTNSYSGSDWLPATSHSVYVRSICGAGDTLDWRGPVSFAMPCEAIILDGTTSFSEGFEGLTTSGTVPTCWTSSHISGPGTSLWGSYSGTAHSGSRMMRLPDMSATTLTDLVSPEFSIFAAGQYQVSLWVKRTSSYTGKVNEGVKVWVNSTPDTVGGTMLFHARRSIEQQPAVSEEGWYEYTGVIPMGGTVYVIMQGISEYGSQTLIDDFSVLPAPSCSDPVGFVYDAESNSVSWTAGSASEWQVQEGDELTIVGNAEYSNPAWAPNTDYSISVRSICGAGDTNGWQPAFAFRTPRAACPAAQPLPYSTDFGGYDYTGNPQNANAPLPDCWTVYSNGTNRPSESSTAAVYYSGIGQAGSINNYGCVTPNNPYFAFMACEPYDGTYTAYTTNMQAYGTRKFAVLPAFEQPLNTLALSFDYSMSARRGAVLHVGYVVSDTSDFTSLYVVPTAYRTLTHIDRLDFAAIDANIPANARLAMLWMTTDTVHTGDAPANIFCGIDNLVVEAAPACKYPRSLVADSVGSHGFRLAWREVSTTPATQWEVVYGPQGFDPETEGTAITATADTISIDGLDRDAYYHAYVRSICGADAYSEWAGPVSVRTHCLNGGNVVFGADSFNQMSVAFYNWGNTICQSLYTPAELAVEGLRPGDTIDHLAYFWKNYNTGRLVKDFTVYMTHTADTAEFPDVAHAEDWRAVSAADQVYSGAIPTNDTGWTRYDFSRPFVWNGTDGIVITTLVNQPAGADHNNTGFIAASSDAGARRVLFDRRDHTAYTLASLSTAGPGSSRYRANIFIERPCLDSTDADTVIVPPTPPPPADTADAGIAAADILFWVGSGPDSAIFVVNSGNVAHAWGYLFDAGDGPTAMDMVTDIDAADPRLAYTVSWETYELTLFYVNHPHRIALGEFGFKVDGELAEEGDMFSDYDIYPGSVVMVSDDTSAFWTTPIVPVAPAVMPVNSTIDAADVTYWLGQGANSAVVAINWGEPDTAMAWGFRWDGAMNVSQLMQALVDADPRLTTDAAMSTFNYTYGLTALHFQQRSGNYMQFILDGNPQAGLNTPVGNGSFLKVGESAYGIGYDSTLFSGEWYPMGVCWPTPIAPVVAFDTNRPVDAAFPADSVLFWVGSGSNSVVMAFNWADTVLAWGFRFSAATTTPGEVMDSIAAADPRFGYSGYGYINDITFTEGGTTHSVTPGNYWWSLLNHVGGMGMGDVLHDGDFYKWGDLAVAVAVDSTMGPWGMEYAYVWPYAIHAASAPSVPPADPVDATIAFSDILYWVGSGSNSAAFIVNFAQPDTAFAWGFRFDGTATAQAMVDSIAAADPRFWTVGNPSNGGDIFFALASGDTLHLSPVDPAVGYNFWWTNLNGVSTAEGAGATLHDGDVFKYGDMNSATGWDFQYGYYMQEAWTTAPTPVSVPTLAIRRVGADALTVSAVDGCITVGGAEGRCVSVYDVMGRLVARSASAAQRCRMTVPGAGVFVVCVDGLEPRRVVLTR